MITIKRDHNKVTATLIEHDKKVKSYTHSYKDSEMAGCVAAELKNMIKSEYGFVAIKNYMIYQML